MSWWRNFYQNLIQTKSIHVVRLTGKFSLENLAFRWIILLKEMWFFFGFFIPNEVCISSESIEISQFVILTVKTSVFLINYLIKFLKVIRAPEKVSSEGLSKNEKSPDVFQAHALAHSVVSFAWLKCDKLWFCFKSKFFNTLLKETGVKSHEPLTLTFFILVASKLHLKWNSFGKKIFFFVVNRFVLQTGTTLLKKGISVWLLLRKFWWI